jgi:transposase InsO family protein
MGLTAVTKRAVFHSATAVAAGNIRSDNSPEFIANAMRRYLEAAEVGTLYIEPGAPWDNGYAEGFTASCATSC